MRKARFQKVIEAERKVSWYRFHMSGTITKKHFFLIAKTFGVAKAIKVLFSGKGTVLQILMMP
jgi:hypothetical protein